jgi:hypothetical protein
MDGNLVEDGKGFGPPNPFLIINISDNVIASSFGDLIRGSDSDNYRILRNLISPNISLLTDFGEAWVV